MSTRSYLVGLPVVLTVADDGTVTAVVDLCEAADIWHDESSDERIAEAARDSEVIARAVDAGTITVRAEQ